MDMHDLYFWLIYSNMRERERESFVIEGKKEWYIPESKMVFRAEHIITKANKRHKHNRAPIAISLSMVEDFDVLFLGPRIWSVFIEPNLLSVWYDNTRLK